MFFLAIRLLHWRLILILVMVLVVLVMVLGLVVLVIYLVDVLALVAVMETSVLGEGGVVVVPD